MRTIGRKWTGSKADYQAMCDVCGVQWLRSKLVRKADGMLHCPDEGNGLDVVSLAEGNARAAETRQYGELSRDGANWDNDPNPVAINPRSIPSVPHNQT